MDELLEDILQYVGPKHLNIIVSQYCKMTFTGGYV